MINVRKKKICLETELHLMDPVTTCMRLVKVNVCNTRETSVSAGIASTPYAYCGLFLLKYFGRFNFTFCFSAAVFLFSFANVKKQCLEDVVSLHCITLLPWELVGRQEEEKRMTNCVH